MCVCVCLCLCVRSCVFVQDGSWTIKDEPGVTCYGGKYKYKYKYKIYL